MNGILKHLFVENPMGLERTRGLRKFFQAGQEGSTVVNRVILGLLGVIYCWVLFVIFYYHEDMSLGLTFLELGFLTLVVPGSLYGAVSGEREKLTWDALIMTRLTPGQILAGKFFSRIPMILSIIALFSVPVLLCHFTENHRNQVEFTLNKLITTQMLVLGWSVFLAGFSLMVSAKTKRSITTLSIVVVSLLAFLVLVPSLTQLFSSNTARYTYNGTSIDYQYDISPLRQVGALLVGVNPFFFLNDISVSGNYSGHQDFYLSLPASGQMILPYVYILLGGLCLGSALKTLRGLELPNQRPEPKRVRPLDPDTAPEQG